MYWRRFRDRGAVAAVLAGTLSSIGLVLLGPAVIGAKGIIFKDSTPPFWLSNPGLFSIPVGFIAGWADRSRNVKRLAMNPSTPSNFEC